MPFRRLLLSLLLGGASFQAVALDFDFDFAPNPQQADFRSAAEDVAAALNYKSLAPAEPAGLSGFAVGAYASYVPTDDENAWQRLIGESLDAVGMVGIVVQKGLPLDIDVGATLSWVPDSDARVYGAKLSWAVMDGGVATPAVALGAHYTTWSGIDQVDFESTGIDLSISKGFGPLTPYAGAGYVWSDFEITDPLVPLQDEDFGSGRVYLGLRLSALFGITPEIERVGDRTSFNLRVGFSF